ncbi:MAG TPA: transcriptional regulator [Chloroflexi bacterium]|nr:transcriptional regulator [Chloroflexota bacterium]
MADQEAILLRNRIIGVLLRDARLRAGRTKRECATVLGVSTSTLTAYEEGRKPISLPELEILARFLQTPLSHFLDPTPELLPEEDLPPAEGAIQLRHRIIGALLRKAREEEGKSRKELAQAVGCSPRRIASYERGERPIPVVELETIARALNRPFSYFLSEEYSLLGEWEREQERIKAFRELPREIQEFVVKPVNRQYIEVAMRLAEMPASALRTIAEGLLEITY